MFKTNLPVILLKGIALLPNNDIRLEFDNDNSKNIIDVAELFHDNHVLVVSSNNPLEEHPDIKDLPRIGIVSKISHRIELPNGKTRVMITGLNRAVIHEYLNLNHNSEVLESIISNVEKEEIISKEEVALIRKLYREIDNYIKNVPYMSNSILSSITNNTSLSKVTDIITPNLPITLERLQEYLIETKPTVRASMILEDIYKEKEMFSIEKEIDLKVRKEIDQSQKEFVLKEKIRVIKEELGEASIKDDEVKKLREALADLKAPSKIKNRLTEEINRYETTSQLSPEISIIRNYIDWLLNIPWNKESKDIKDLKKVKNNLDKSHYGLEKVKTRIIEYLAVKQIAKDINSPIICLVGPPGVGKTSLVYSIAAAINRQFVKISVGGVNDESEIMGHRRTYLGSSPGRIIQAMKKATTINPVFLIDEIDKMTKDIKGDPASSLLEVLDLEQNKHFSDNYIEEEYDLSKILFITTANYLENIPEPLKDRLEIIELSSYTEYEKLDIAKEHLIPKIIKNHGIEDKNIIFEDDAILEIITKYTKEAGVRELERLLSTVIRKIVTSIVVDKTKINKLAITTSNLNIYLGLPKYYNNQITRDEIGVVTGLAYTSFGGATLDIEVTLYQGTGNLILTGSLGTVMKESATIALSYIKANHKYFNIDYDKIIKNDIHIHVPDGSVPKEGPSAGIALTTALISAFTNKKFNKKIALTGEITLRGHVLPIGGLKEKTIGALRNGITTIIIPKDNINDVQEVPDIIRNKITYIPVDNYKEVIKYMEGKNDKNFN